MKILYMYHEYGGRRKLYGEMLKHQGHEVHYFHVNGKSKPNQFSVKHIKKVNPDVLFLLSPFYVSKKVITDECLEYVKTKGIILTTLNTLNTQVEYPETLDVWKLFDVLFIHNAEFNNYLNEQSLQSFYIPLAYYPDQYYRKSVQRDLEVSFYGQSTNHCSS